MEIRVRWLLIPLLAACLARHDAAQSRPELTYQNRGHYSEGIRAAPSVGPVALDLVAAMVDYHDPYAALPQTFRALVYVPPQAPPPVYLTIRETGPRYFYWLDKAQPESGWRVGAPVEFAWPTSTVIRSLNWRDSQLSLDDLAAAARLERPEPASVERVLPVALYHSRPPASADGYRFVFRPDKRMRLRFQLVAGSTGKPVQPPQVFPSVLAAEPHTVRFPTGGWPDGWYRLAVSGYALSNNAEIDMEVRFYHSRRLGR
jgi:hypothetical protein